MGSHVFLAENLFNARQFSGHGVSANEEADGFQAWRVSSARRSGLSYWTPTTFNAAAWVKASCDRVRAANMIVLDRGHNLGGKQIKLQASDDDSTWRDVLDLIVPSTSGPGSIDDPQGVVTEEGAWLKRFTLDAAKYWRKNVPAMGADLKPEVTGLWVGLSWSPDGNMDWPFNEDGGELVTQEAMSDAGWIARGRRTFRRRGQINLRLIDAQAYDQARYQLGHFASGSPMWMVSDVNQSNRAVLALMQGALDFAEVDGWIGKRSGSIGWVEHEPRASL